MLLEKSGDMDLGPSEGPTGYVGQRLLDALAAFQRRNGLNETGMVRPGDATHRALIAEAGRNPEQPPTDNRSRQPLPRTARRLPDRAGQQAAAVSGRPSQPDADNAPTRNLMRRRTCQRT